MNTANLFQGETGNIDFNACVGENGWVGIKAYIDGYQSATLAMLESVLAQYIPDADNRNPKKAFCWGVDTAVYPIIFSARHFLELFLKQQTHIIYTFKIQEDIKERLMKTHDIKKLWDLFVEASKKTSDSRINKYVDLLEIYIIDLNSIDSTGETFRYPYSTNNQMHLKNQRVIGLLNFYEKFNELSEICEKFSYLMSYLFQEYQCKTYTKNLNREDIREISKELPIIDRWSDSSFSTVRETIKSKFNISGRELSQVIDIIKEHREFKQAILPNTYELEIERIKLTNFLKNSYTNNDVNEFSNEEVSCLITLSELGTGSWYFSEDYDYLYKEYLKEIENFDYEKKSNYEYSLRNPSRITEGLKIIGYDFLLENHNT